MMITEGNKKVFDEVLERLQESGLSKHIMLIGSWAEFIYESTNLVENYISAMRTNDIDFLVMNLRRPPDRTDFLTAMKNSGFHVVSNFIDDVTKFIAPDKNMEIEFLIHEMGAGQNKGYPVESLGFSVIGLRHLNILRDNPTSVEYQDRHVIVPKPEAYMLHKLVINEKRGEEKQVKDIKSVKLISEALLPRTDSIDYLQKMWKSLTEKEQNSAKKATKEFELYEIGEVLSSFSVANEVPSPQPAKKLNFAQRLAAEAKNDKGRGGR